MSSWIKSTQPGGELPASPDQLKKRTEKVRTAGSTT